MYGNRGLCELRTVIEGKGVLRFRRKTSSLPGRLHARPAAIALVQLAFWDARQLALECQQVVLVENWLVNVLVVRRAHPVLRLAGANFTPRPKDG